MQRDNPEYLYEQQTNLTKFANEHLSYVFAKRNCC